MTMLDSVQLAGVLPRNPRFREWVAKQASGISIDESAAAWFIRDACSITSRRDLATNPEAAQRFHNLIRKPFVAFCEQLEEPV